MKDETLLPCPFCGGEPEEEGGTFVEYYGHERQDYSITCKQCGAEVRCDVGDFEGADAVCSCHHDTRKICADKWNSRAIQSGNSAQPVTVPDGYVLVPVEPTQEMLTASYLFTHVDNTIDSWKAMLAAAPKAPDGWIPVNERMPPYGKYLVMYEYGRPGGALAHAVARYMKFDKSPPNNEIVSAWVCGIKGVHNITHWQPLPDAPKVMP